MTHPVTVRFCVVTNAKEPESINFLNETLRHLIKLSIYVFLHTHTPKTYLDLLIDRSTHTRANTHTHTHTLDDQLVHYADSGCFLRARALSRRLQSEDGACVLLVSLSWDHPLGKGSKTLAGSAPGSVLLVSLIYIISVVKHFQKCSLLKY